VFLNIPFDNVNRYERCYLALIAGLVSLGFVPRSVLEIPAGAADRQRRILNLLKRCRYSIHDLSRVESSAGRFPRFNMPFEAGLASALALGTPNQHDRFIVETRPRRVLRTLSDLNGVDVYGHGGTPTGVLRELTNIFARPGVDLIRLRRVFRGLSRYAEREIRPLAGPAGLFQPSAFIRLVIAAREQDRLLASPVAREFLGYSRPRRTS
jgi:hypothetical protein